MAHGNDPLTPAQNEEVADQLGRNIFTATMIGAVGFVLACAFMVL